MQQMLDEMKNNAKKEKLKELIKMLSEKMLDDEDSDLDYYKDKMKSEDDSKEQIEESRETPRLNEESEEKLLEDMGEHEEEEIVEGEERLEKDDGMLKEIKEFMRMKQSPPDALKNKISKRMMADPSDVPQRTQKQFKSSPDNFDVSMIKKKKIKMK